MLGLVLPLVLGLVLLLVLGLVLLLVLELALPLVPGVSLRTCLVTLSQHLPALGEVVVVDV